MSPYRRQRFNDTITRALQCRKTPFVRTLPCPKTKSLAASLAIVRPGSTWLLHPSGRTPPAGPVRYKSLFSSVGFYWKKYEETRARVTMSENKIFRGSPGFEASSRLHGFSLFALCSSPQRSATKYCVSLASLSLRQPPGRSERGGSCVLLALEKIPRRQEAHRSSCQRTDRGHREARHPASNLTRPLKIFRSITLTCNQVIINDLVPQGNYQSLRRTR